MEGKTNQTNKYINNEKVSIPEHYFKNSRVPVIQDKEVHKKMYEINKIVV